MNESIPNAFVFKVFIKGEYRMCVCPRVNDKWAEKDIFYVDNPQADLYNTLQEKLFHIIFVSYEKDDKGGFWIKPSDKPFFVKSDTVIAEDLYRQDKFFSTIEKAYKEIYEQSESTSGQGGQTSSSEEK